MKKKQLIFTGIVTTIAAIVGIIIYKKSKKHNTNSTTEEIKINTVNSSVSNDVNKNLILKKGSQGKEVEQLQKTLGSLIVDGDFGTKTDNRLWDVFRLSQITLNELKIFYPKASYVKIIHDRGKKVNVKTLYSFDINFLKDWSNAITKNQKTFDYGIQTYSTDTGTATTKVISLV
jgi:hypothetical protein